MTEAVKQKVRLRMQDSRAGIVHVNRRALRLVVVLALLMGTLTAFALTRGFGLFEMMGSYINPEYSAVRPEARELLQTDLASYSFEHVDVVIQEALYDGRYLRVAYRVRDRAATEPLGDNGVDVETLVKKGEPYFTFPAAELDKVAWNTLDWCEVDGHNCNPLGPTASYATGEPGELVSWLQFDVDGLELAEEATVRLPIRGMDTPKELDFNISTRLVGVHNIKLPQPKRFANYTVHVTEFLMTPIRNYIKMAFVIDPGVSLEDAYEVERAWFSGIALSNEDGSNKMVSADMGVGFSWDNYKFDVITHEDGSLEGVETILDPKKPLTLEMFHEFTTKEDYPEVFRLGTKGEHFILIPNIKEARD
ncbi:MAG TPA: hypothetical protein GX006_07050 [Clostridiales bacterium]|jgi:hypothetical protein|nr:hypothetical protein [Clostridiales bacterium]